MDALRRLGTTNLIFEPKGVCLGTNVVQIILTCVMCGRASSFAVIWWPAFDSARVLVSVVARMDYLLREQLPGQETIVERDRRVVLVINVLGILFAPTVFAYKPFVSRTHLPLAILALVILFSHFLTSLPPLYHMLKGYSLDAEPEEANRPLLDEHSRADSYDSASNSPALEAEMDDQKEIEPPTVSADLIQQAIMDQIRSRGGGLQTERRAVVAQQDAEYEAMVAAERRRQASQSTVDVELTPSPPRGREPPPPYAAPEPVPEEEDTFSLPPEPSAGETSAVDLRLKMLDGSTLKRRFPSSTELGLIKSWAEHEADEKDIQIATRMPRKVFSSEDFSKSLEALKVGRDILFVERKS